MNGIEEDSKAVRFEGCELSVEAGKFQPKTYRVTLAEPSVSLAAPESRFVEIPCNVNAISPDGFRPESNVDNRGNSYAAELLPETIVNDGIRFKRGKLGVPNAVRCQGQIIALPQDKAYTKLYLLAAATDRDRHADFSVDGKPYGFDVPYYSDFFGQWGQQTVSEGYVKHGKLAHVGTHRHNAVRGNDAYVFTYLYQLGLDIEPGAKELRLARRRAYRRLRRNRQPSPPPTGCFLQQRSAPFRKRRLPSPMYGATQRTWPKEPMWSGFPTRGASNRR